MVPDVGVSMAASRWSSVDLPQPDGPVTATVSPAPMVRSIPVSARTWPGNVRVEGTGDEGRRGHWSLTHS